MVSTESVLFLYSVSGSAVHDQPLYPGTLQHLHTTQQQRAVDCKSMTGLPAGTSLQSCIFCPES
jgi:hypothetical protein